MTVTELLDQLQGYVSRHPREAAEQRVVVETHNGGCPHRYMSPVVTATSGFDWTASLFVIRTSDHLVVERVIEKPLSEAANDRLEVLQEQHEKMGFKYLHNRSHAASWIAGFIEGARAHITGLGGER